MAPGRDVMGIRVTCPTCARDLDDVPVSHACPGCHRLGREVGCQTSGWATVVALPAVVDVRAASHRPWWAAWFDLQDALEDLRGAYQPGAGLGIRGMRARVERFFAACGDFGAGLEHVRALRRDDVRSVLEAEPLSLAHAFLVDVEHAGVDDPTHPHGWVSWHRSSPYGDRVGLEFGPLTEWPRMIDALDLADRCFRTWEEFLARRGQGPPRR